MGAGSTDTELIGTRCPYVLAEGRRGQEELPDKRSKAQVTGVADEKPPSRRVRADKKRNRDRILRAAETLIAERGAGIPLEEIARAADVGSATVHRHFGDRRKLLDTVFRDRAEALAAKSVYLAGQGTAGWALAAWLCELHDLVAETKGLSQALASATGDLLSADMTCRYIVWEAGDQLLRRAQGEGLVPSDVVMDELMGLILGVELAADAGLLGAADSTVLVERVIKSIAFGGAEPPEH